MVGTRFELWRYDGRSVRAVRRGARSESLKVVPTGTAGWVTTQTGEAWCAPVPGATGFWLTARGPEAPRAATLAAPVLAQVVAGHREVERVARELSERCQEIELLYTMSEVLGHTVQLREAAQILLREVADVVGARRASIVVADDDDAELRVVAARGFLAHELAPVPVNDDLSVAARVFREQRILAYDPTDPRTVPATGEREQPYRGRAYLSVPIVYAPAGGPLRPIGVINLTDRLGEDRFSDGHRRLVAAVAHQIGAAIENMRRVERDLEQQRVEHELELAHDLQMRLLPSTSFLAGHANVAARCQPVRDVSGDFYQLFRLPGGRVGAMIGDVSSHGFAAALIMALTMSAAAIHAEAAASPTETLKRLAQSLEPELARTDMFLTLLYAVLAPEQGELVYASAGHAHAFRIRGDGAPPDRLPATAPPLGLAATETLTDVRIPWRAGDDRLLLFTDGLVDALNAGGERFGETRLLELVARLCDFPIQAVVDEVFAEVEAFSEGTAETADDRTMLLLTT